MLRKIVLTANAVLCLFCSSSASAQLSGNTAEAVREASELKQAKLTKLSTAVTCVGYLAPNAILIFPQQPKVAIFAKEGDTVNGVTLLSVHDTAVRARSGGQDFAMAATDKPFAVPEYALQDYIVNLCNRMDKLERNVSENVRVTIGPGGMPVSDPSASQYFVRAMPFGPLPQGVQAITFDVKFGPEASTSAHIVQLVLQ